MSARSVSLKGVDSNSPLPVDVVSGGGGSSLPAVLTGSVIQASYFDDDINNDNTLEVLIQCHASFNLLLHLLASCHEPFSEQNIDTAGGDSEHIGTGSSLLEIFEGPTFSAAGEAITVEDRNRVLDASLNATVTGTPTTSVDGTLIYQREFHNDFDAGDFLLKADTDYLIRLTVMPSNLFDAHSAASIDLRLNEVAS